MRGFPARPHPGAQHGRALQQRLRLDEAPAQAQEVAEVAEQLGPVGARGQGGAVRGFGAGRIAAGRVQLGEVVRAFGIAWVGRERRLERVHRRIGLAQ
jgi:hypothetical protein